jgi:hypothetical protein
MKRKKPSNPIDPKSVFQLACKFASTGMYVSERSNVQAAFMASPSMVLSSFATELFLKCLLLLEGKEIDRIHTLNVLYRRLSHNRKRRIEEAWEKEARPKIDKLRQFGFAHPSDLPNALVTCARAFERLRYGYEDPDRQVFYLSDLPTILWRIILDIRPEWEKG